VIYPDTFSGPTDVAEPFLWIEDGMIPGWPDLRHMHTLLHPAPHWPLLYWRKNIGCAKIGDISEGLRYRNKHYTNGNSLSEVCPLYT